MLRRSAADVKPPSSFGAPPEGLYTVEPHSLVAELLLRMSVAEAEALVMIGEKVEAPITVSEALTLDLARIEKERYSILH